MNLVGQIITILILLLSVCFMMVGVMVNASHQNWKEQALANKAKVEELARNRDAIRQKTTEKEILIEKEKVARMLRIQQLESQLALALRDYNRANDELAAQRVKAQESFTVVKESEQRIAVLDKTNENLQAQLRRLTDDVAAQRAKVVSMTSEIFNQKSDLKNLEIMRDDLASEVTKSRQVMLAHGLTVNSLTDHIPMELEGRVTFVIDNTISLNLGTDDGLRKGHTIDLYRAGRYVGSARVFEAEHNRSAATIDAAKTKIPVQINDQVTTRWVLSQK